jgi:NAD(P)-dependent dehydrogenase (short-subunit alcohol dehydrogenase family)
MKVDLEGKSFRLVGVPGALCDVVIAALEANGARAATEQANILVVAHQLLPSEPGSLDVQPATFTDEIAMMAADGGGRIIFLLSAMASIPMRRHIDYSAAMASAVTRMRVLAMQHGPHILVNAVGAGMIEDESGDILSGSQHMLSHIPLAKAGTAEDVANAVLFLSDPLNSYTTGQLLTVDGGWSAGYARNF